MTDEERLEREQRAARLRKVRADAGFAGPKAVADALNINVNTYKAHEAGRNGFSVAAGNAYADLFGVSAVWLYMEIGARQEPYDGEAARSLRALMQRIANAADVVRERIVAYAEFELTRIDTATR
ncbi:MULTISPECIES: helix-turn-helix transcriptional regulator [Mesorhizobium]|uniref:helix-turn-helix transcriptional regulator n=1 Tax=Mesorhizobium TaxID=68287 RepID=UPI0010A96C4C|nr:MULTISPECIES: helix-turn-helix transcriptional regulator [Mesorhizobium]